MRSKKLLFLYGVVWLLAKNYLCDATIPNGWTLPPITISDYLAGYTMIADSLSVAMDDSGNAMAIWKAKSGSDVYLLVAYFEVATNAWNPLVRTFKTEADVSGSPLLRMNALGDAFIMWQEQDVPDYIINCINYAHGTSWASWFPVIVGLNSASQLPLYQCAINESGDALFVYSSGSTYVSALYDHTTRWDHWIPSTVVMPIASSANTLNLSLDNSARGLAVYSVASDVFATQYISSVWTTATQVNTIGSNASQVNLALEKSSGKNYIVWVEDDTSVHATQFGQMSKTLDTLVGLTVGAVKEIIDVAGHVTFMWTANASATGNLKTTYFNNATWNSWSPVVSTIATSASGPITHWNMAAQPANPYQVFAVWELYDGSQYTVYANEATNGSWILAATQSVFVLGNNRAVGPQLGVNGSGDAIALWGQATDQQSATKILVSAIWYDAATALWQDKSTILSNSCYCNCV